MIKVIFFDLGETLVDENKRLIEGADKMLENLRKENLRLGIISNTGNLEREKIIQSLPAELDIAVFEESLIIFSSEASIEKPDPKIFKLALAKANVPAEECLFCTENLVHSLAAQTVGLKTARVIPPPASDIANLNLTLAKANLLT